MSFAYKIDQLDMTASTGCVDVVHPFQREERGIRAIVIREWRYRTGDR